MNIPLTLMIFAVLPLMIFFTRFFNQAACAPPPRTAAIRWAKSTPRWRTRLLGIRVVKSFANEELEERKIRTGQPGAFCECKKRQYAYMAGFGTSQPVCSTA